MRTGKIFTNGDTLFFGENDEAAPSGFASNSTTRFVMLDVDGSAGGTQHFNLATESAPTTRIQAGNSGSIGVDIYTQMQNPPAANAAGCTDPNNVIYCYNIRGALASAATVTNTFDPSPIITDQTTRMATQGFTYLDNPRFATQ